MLSPPLRVEWPRGRSLTHLKCDLCSRPSQSVPKELRCLGPKLCSSTTL